MNGRISAQAKTVLEVLASKRCHLTAEEILASLDNIGTATVYRALDHLTEMGLIRRLSVGKRSAVYEYIRDQHMHLVCSRCGKDFDTTIKAEDITTSVPLDDGTDEIDLTDEIRESILLELPNFPLCDENCEGMEGVGVDAGQGFADAATDSRTDGLGTLGAALENALTN